VARRLLLGALLAGGLALPTSQAAAAAPPLIQATYVTDATSTSANLRTEVNPQGQSTTYRFEYLALAAYEANVKAAKEPFAGAAKAPASGSASAGAGTVTVLLTQHLAGLGPQTLYRFRVVATNASGTTTGPERTLGTQAPTNAFSLLDGRGWEMVSPVDKNGGAIQAPEGIFGGGDFQAAANGNSITYSSADSFAGGVGAPPGSQYVATRGGSGWSTQNITTPLLAGSYGQEPDGVPYRLFSEDLSRGLLSNGQRCRTEPGECPVVNPPLPGSGAVSGYRDYYLHGGGAFASLLSAADLEHTSLVASQLEIGLAGATDDLSEVVLTSCAALTANATEVTAPGGCAGQNLYLWQEGSLTAVNLLPGETTPLPGPAWRPLPPTAIAFTSPAPKTAPSTCAKGLRPSSCPKPWAAAPPSRRPHPMAATRSSSRVGTSFATTRWRSWPRISLPRAVSWECSAPLPTAPAPTTRTARACSSGRTAPQPRSLLVSKPPRRATTRRPAAPRGSAPTALISSSSPRRN
jgi:hypothetical protein